VFFNSNMIENGKRVFQCPLCLIRKNRPYPRAEVRIKYIEDAEPIYVDVRACLETFSKDLIKMTLPPPTINTVFLDLIRFTPGCPERSSFNGSGTRLTGMVGDNGPRTHEDPSTSLARALVAPHTLNDPHNKLPLSPRGEKRKLSIDEDGRSPHINNRLRPEGGTWPNGSPSQKLKKSRPRESGAGEQPTKSSRLDEDAFNLQSSQPPNGRPSSSSVQTQSPAVRKIKLVVKPSSSREAS